MSALDDRLGRASPRLVLALMGAFGLYGGYAVNHSAVSEREADKAAIRRDRYEDLLERCMGHRLDTLEGRQP